MYGNCTFNYCNFIKILYNSKQTYCSITIELWSMWLISDCRFNYSKDTVVVVEVNINFRLKQKQRVCTSTCSSCRLNYGDLYVKYFDTVLLALRNIIFSSIYINFFLLIHLYYIILYHYIFVLKSSIIHTRVCNARRESVIITFVLYFYLQTSAKGHWCDTDIFSRCSERLTCPLTHSVFEVQASIVTQLILI